MSRRTKKTKKDHQKKRKDTPKKEIIKKVATKQGGLLVRVLGRPKIDSEKKSLTDVVMGEESTIEQELLLARESAKEKIAPIAPEDNLLETEALRNRKELERNKRIIMWSGIAFFMIVIVFFWVYNTKKVFEAERLKNQNQTIAPDLDQLVDELSDKINEMKEDIESVRSLSSNFASTTEISTASSTRDFSTLPVADSASSSDETSALDSEEMKELKEVLEEKVNQKIKIVY